MKSPNPALARHYGIEGVSGDTFQRVALQPGSRRGGLLGHGSILTLTSNGVETQPVLRGVWVLENLLGTPPSPPPPDVQPVEPDTRGVTTIRELMAKHRTIATCNECHRKIDPIGLALENFDSIGQFRKLENGKPINVSADIFGQKYEGAPGIGQYLHDDPQTSACVVQKAYSYGVGRPYDYQDAGFVQTVQSQFEENGYKLKGLFRSILTDPKFYDVVVPDGLERAKTSAQIETQDVAQGGLK